MTRVRLGVSTRRCQLKQIKAWINADHIAGETKLRVGRPPDFYLQIQEDGEMTYDAMREARACLVERGRKYR